ncbi:MAG: translocation/assembly module TamB domain-containing protein [bacterium]
MHIKNLYTHFKSNRLKYLILLLLITLLILTGNRLKKNLERHGDVWVRGYLKSHVRLDINWNRLEWHPFSSLFILNGLRIKGEEPDMPPFLILVDRTRLSYNPFSLVFKRIVNLQQIRINGLKGRLMLPESMGTADLKSLFLIRDEHRTGGDKSRGLSFRLGRVLIEGKDFALDLPFQKADLTLRDFSFFLSHLDQKGAHPVSLVFKEGECHWKGLYRFLESGEIKGSINPQGVVIDAFHVDFPEEGELNWTGEISKEKEGIMFDGQYSGMLYSDTLAHFLKPFRRMKGRVASKGYFGRKNRKLKVGGDLKAAEFSWRGFDFTKVTGNYSYHLGMLEFKDVKAGWRNGYLDLASSIALKEKKATVYIHAEELPSFSLIDQWSKIIPKHNLIWLGDMEWHITWPEKVMQSDGVLQMAAPFSSSKKYANEQVVFKTGFRSLKKQLFLHDTELVIRDNHIQAKGEYDFSKKTADLEYRCDIKDRELISRIWDLSFKGYGGIYGRMEGPLSEPGFTGRVAGEGIELFNYPLDRMDLNYDYHRKDLILSDIRGKFKDTGIAGKGRVNLTHSFERPDFEFSWSVDGLPLSEFIGFTSYRPEYPYQGWLYGRGHLTMLKGRLSSKGSFHGRDVTLLGQPAMDMEASFAVSEGRIHLEDLMASRGESKINGAFSYLKGKGMSIRADVSSWHVYPVHLSSGRRIPIEGVFDLNIDGDTNRLSGGFKAGHLSFRERGDLDFSGEFNVRDKQIRASILCPWGEADFEAGLEADLPFRINSLCESLSILDPKTGLFLANKGYTTLLNGDLEIKGLLKGGLGSMEGRFEGRDLLISGPAGNFKSTAPYEIRLTEKVLSTPSLAMQGDNGTLDFKGAWMLPDGIDMNITGIIPLDVFQDKVVGLKGLKGKSELDLKLKGTIDDPLMQGEIELSEGTFSLPEYNFRVDNVQGTLWLTRKSIYVRNLSAETRGGGWIELNGVVLFQGRDLDSFNLRADFDDLYIYRRNAYKGFLEGQLEWTGREDFGMLTGDLLVKEARNEANQDILQLLLSKKREIEADHPLEEGIAKGWGEWFKKTQVNIGLDLGEDFWIRNPFYNATLKGNIWVKGSITSPWLDGEIEAEEGEIIIGSQRFDLVSGKIRLTDPAFSEPTLNAVALNDIDNFRLRLSVFGPLSQPNLQFSSTPYLSPAEILNMVFFGLTTEEAERGEQQGDIISLMFSTTGHVLNNVFGEDVSYYTGMDMIKLTYFPQDLFRLDILNVELEEEGGGVERLTLGKTLSRRLKIKYSHLKGEEQREIAEAEYTVTDHLTLIGAQDNEGTYSFDLNIGFSF